MRTSASCAIRRSARNSTTRSGDRPLKPASSSSSSTVLVMLSGRYMLESGRYAAGMAETSPGFQAFSVGRTGAGMTSAPRWRAGAEMAVPALRVCDRRDSPTLHRCDQQDDLSSVIARRAARILRAGAHRPSVLAVASNAIGFLRRALRDGLGQPLGHAAPAGPGVLGMGRILKFHLLRSLRE